MKRGIGSLNVSGRGLRMDSTPYSVHAFARMRDLTGSGMMWLKGLLLFLIGSVSAALIFLEAPTLKLGILLALTIWGFCRAYYFAFYVIGHYVDPGYRFSGLLSFCVYCWRRGRNP